MWQLSTLLQLTVVGTALTSSASAAQTGVEETKISSRTTQENCIGYNNDACESIFSTSSASCPTGLHNYTTMKTSSTYTCTITTTPKTPTHGSPLPAPPSPSTASISDSYSTNSGMSAPASSIDTPVPKSAQCTVWDPAPPALYSGATTLWSSDPALVPSSCQTLSWSSRTFSSFSSVNTRSGSTIPLLSSAVSSSTKAIETASHTSIASSVSAYHSSDGSPVSTAGVAFTGNAIQKYKLSATSMLAILGIASALVL